MRTRGEVVGLLALCVLGGLLAGCGGGATAVGSSPVPITTTSSRTSASPTTSPSTTLDPNSDAAIRAGVERWVAALNIASRGSTVTPLIDSATSVCTCLSSERDALNYLSQHGLHLTVNYRVYAYKLISRTATAALSKVTISTTAYQALRADGSTYKVEPAGSVSNEFSMKLKGSRWLVDTVL